MLLNLEQEAETQTQLEEAKAQAARQAKEQEAKAEADRKAKEQEAQAQAALKAKEQEAKVEAARKAKEQEAKAQAAREAKEQEAQAQAAREAKEQEAQAQAQAKARAQQLARDQQLQQQATAKARYMQLLADRKEALAKAQVELRELEIQCQSESAKAGEFLANQVTPAMPGECCKPESGHSPGLRGAITPTEPESPGPSSPWSQDAQPRRLFPPTPDRSSPEPPASLPPPANPSKVKAAPAAVKTAPPPPPQAIASAQALQVIPSSAAINRRLSRAMEPTARGEFKVAENIRKQFQAGGTSKDGVIRLFAKCGYNTDRLLSCCHVMRGDRCVHACHV